MRPRHRSRKGRRALIGRHVAALTLGLLFAACDTGQISTEEYLPDRVADLYLPSLEPSSRTVPLVVMIPGGAWVTADRSGLAPLASYLSDRGIAVANATIRGAAADFRFPGPVQDVMCAVDAAVERMRQRGLTPAPVVLMGHSSGAHLGALAVLGAVDERGDCPHPPSRIDAALLLSGIYDLALAADVAQPLMGATPEEDPAGWRAASAFTWVTNRPGVPVFLAHGARDQLVPVSSTTRFATALERAGHAVRVDIVADADHHEIYSPDALGREMAGWITMLG